MSAPQSPSFLEKAKTTLKSLFKATVYNFSANPAVFYVPANSTVKHLKDRYSEEASNPLSDILYPLDPETNERPDPIAGGIFVPASVLVFIDDDGRQLGDDELILPHVEDLSDTQEHEFSTQLVIPTFEADMPVLYSLLEKQNDCDEDMDDQINPPPDWINPISGKLVLADDERFRYFSMWGLIRHMDKATVVACMKADVCGYVLNGLIFGHDVKRDVPEAFSGPWLFKRQVFDDKEGRYLVDVRSSWSETDVEQIVDEMKSPKSYVEKMFFHMDTDLFARTMGYVYYWIMTEIRNGGYCGYYHWGFCQENANFFKKALNWRRNCLGLNDFELLFTSVLNSLTALEDSDDLNWYDTLSTSYRNDSINFFQSSMEELLSLLRRIDEDCNMGPFKKHFYDFFYAEKHDFTRGLPQVSKHYFRTKTSTILSRFPDLNYEQVASNLKQPKYDTFFGIEYCKFMQKKLSQNDYEELYEDADAELARYLNEQCEKAIEVKEKKEREIAEDYKVFVSAGLK